MSQFTFNVLTFLVALTLHLYLVWRISRPLQRRGWSRRSVWLTGFALILLLDLPLAYMQILFKGWHPMTADRIMHAIWVPWGLVQFNLILVGLYLAVVGTLRLIGRLFRRSLPGKRQVRSVGMRTGRSSDSEGEDLTDKRFVPLKVEREGEALIRRDGLAANESLDCLSPDRADNPCSEKESAETLTALMQNAPVSREHHPRHNVKMNRTENEMSLNNIVTGDTTTGPLPGPVVPAGTTPSDLDNDPSLFEEIKEKIGSKMPRRRFVRSALMALGGVAANATLLSAANSDEDSVVELIKIGIPDLPEAFHGMTIGMISDIHSSTAMQYDRMSFYAEKLQGLKSDLIVITGDFVNSKVEEVYPFAEAFGSLTAPHGVYGVTGNHDYYTGDIETVVREVEQAGIRVLMNENVKITRDGVSLRLLGLDDKAIYDVKDYLKDGKTEKGLIENTFAGIDEGESTILLCHKPYPFESYAEADVDLMLSGHTHGGQIVIGKADRMNLSFASLASTYIAGLYKARTNSRSQMYVARGVGTAGIPLRVNCPPEITHIKLVRA